MRIVAAFLAGVVLASGGAAFAHTGHPIASLLARVVSLETNGETQDARLAALEAHNRQLETYLVREQEMVFCLQEAMRQLRPVSRRDRHVVAAPYWTRCYQSWR